MTVARTSRMLAALGLVLIFSACPRSPREALPPEGVAAGKPKMATGIPGTLRTPPRVETRLGTLEFFDGYPSRETVEKVYDHLLFMRGVQAFLSNIPFTSNEVKI